MKIPSDISPLPARANSTAPMDGALIEYCVKFFLLSRNHKNKTISNKGEIDDKLCDCTHDLHASRVRRR
jgi:hypothetical protein